MFLFAVGCRHSTKYTYYQDGSTAVRCQVNKSGQRDGDYVEFYPNGDTLIHCNYFTEQLDGTFKYYYDHNILYYSVQYTRGRLIAINSYKLPDGRVIQQDLFKNGNGFIYVYGRGSGNLISKRTYSNGVPHGMKYTYFSGGGMDSVMVDSNSVPSFAKYNFPPFD